MSVRATLVVGADVGGTNTKVALAHFSKGRPVLRKWAVYPSGNYASLELLIEAFLNEAEVAPHAGSIAAACFAVAGPVEEGRARRTNLPWHIEAEEIERRFGFPHVEVINDFAAAGLGIAHLGADDLLTLQVGTLRERANRVVVGAGTGLGVALLDWDQQTYEVHSSEAGHADLAPIDALQDRLLLHLREQFPRVSYERVLSGRGFSRIAQFLIESGIGEPSPPLREALERGDAASTITELALARQDPVAVQTLDLFVSTYGSFAGNMALTMLAHGGVYIAGGIAPKIAAKLQDGTFMRAFTAKGRMHVLLETMPVHVVMNVHVGLYGALAEAARLAR
jgi:glucokinase